MKFPCQLPLVKVQSRQVYYSYKISLHIVLGRVCNRQDHWRGKKGEIGDRKIFCKISDFFFYIFVLKILFYD